MLCANMPIKMGKKSYKTFSGAVKAIQKKKGWSKKKASAYVATVDRRQNKKK
jgi:hypothetical protein